MRLRKHETAESFSYAIKYIVDRLKQFFFRFRQ